MTKWREKNCVICLSMLVSFCESSLHDTIYKCIFVFYLKRTRLPVDR